MPEATSGCAALSALMPNRPPNDARPATPELLPPTPTDPTEPRQSRQRSWSGDPRPGRMRTCRPCTRIPLSSSVAPILVSSSVMFQVSPGRIARGKRSRSFREPQGGDSDASRRWRARLGGRVHRHPDCRRHLRVSGAACPQAARGDRHSFGLGFEEVRQRGSHKQFRHADVVLRRYRCIVGATSRRFSCDESRETSG